MGHALYGIHVPHTCQKRLPAGTAGSEVGAAGHPEDEGTHGGNANPGEAEGDWVVDHAAPEDC